MVTATFEIGFHTLRKEIVSGTLTQNALILTRIVSMQGLLRQNYAVLLFQNTETASVLYKYKKSNRKRKKSHREKKIESKLFLLLKNPVTNLQNNGQRTIIFQIPY